MHFVGREFTFCIVFVTPLRPIVLGWKWCTLIHLQSSTSMWVNCQTIVKQYKTSIIWLCLATSSRKGNNTLQDGIKHDKETITTRLGDYDILAMRFSILFSTSQEAASSHQRRAPTQVTHFFANFVLIKWWRPSKVIFNWMHCTTYLPRYPKICWMKNCFYFPSKLVQCHLNITKWRLHHF